MYEKENYSSHEFRNMLDKLPNEIRVFEHGIRGEVMEEYRKLAAIIAAEEQLKELNFLDLELQIDQSKENQEYAKKKKNVAPKKMSAKSIIAALRRTKTFTNVEGFKRNVVHAANTASIDVYRFLKSYVDTVPDEHKEWVYAAIMQCQMHLENSLMDEPVGFIATALGGRGNKIRYYFAVTSRQEMTPEDGELVLDEYTALSEEFEIGIEDCYANKDFVLFKVLVPYYQMITDFITSGLNTIDTLDDAEFWITNIVHPSDQALLAWADAKKSETQQ